MPFRKLPFIKDHFYHIFSRGNRKETIFFEERDYRRFLEKCGEYKGKFGIDIVTYCLMPNHFHLLLKQLSPIPVSKFMASLQSSHSHYLSTKKDLPSGQLFQGRFGATLINSTESLLQVSRYIHLNPIKEDLLKMDFTQNKSRILRSRKLVVVLRTYPWSGYRFYLQAKEKIVPVSLNTSYILEEQKGINSYRKFVESKICDEDMLNLESF